MLPTGTSYDAPPLLPTAGPEFGGGSGADLTQMTKEWRRLQSQKWRMRGGIESRILIAIAMYFGEQTIIQQKDNLLTRGQMTEADKNRLSLVFNMLRKHVRRRMGRLWSVAMNFNATPNKTDPRAFDQADVVGDLIRALNCKVKEKRQHWLRLWWMLVGGVVLEHTPWIDDTTTESMPVFDDSGELLWKEAPTGLTLPQSLVEQKVMSGAVPEWYQPLEQPTIVGDVGSEIISPLNFFIDAAIPTLDQLPPGQGCFIVQIKTKEWMADVFGGDVLDKLQSTSSIDLGIVKTRLLDRGPSLSGTNLKDLVPAIQGSRGPGDPPFYLVATRYERDGKDHPKGRRTIFVPNQLILDDGDCYEGQIPLTDFHYDPPGVSFWTQDFVTDLIPAQKFFNKRMSQMGESANATIHEVLLLGGELGPDDIPSDIPGFVENGMDEQGQPRVQPMQRSPLPHWFLEATMAVQEWLDKVGGSDLTSHKVMPGQIRGPLALPLLQELMDSEDGPVFSHLGEQLALTHQQRVNRVKQFYPPIRTLHYTDRNQKDEVLVFHTEDILRAGTDFTITVDQSSLVPELSALRRARVLEDLNSPLAILYTNRRTGKLDSSKIAARLKYGDEDAEDREAQYRKLAQHLIARLWQGQDLPPEIPYAFWDHNAMLDEYESQMATTAWLEASGQVKQAFIGQYEKHRNFLAAIQQAQMDSVQAQMMQGAIAQATQQAAAKAAAVATDAALGQVEAQKQMAQAAPPAQRMLQGPRPMAPLPGGGGPVSTPPPAPLVPTNMGLPPGA